MKRDMDLVREILLRIEKGERPEGLISNIKKPKDEVYYHIKIMSDFGLINAEIITAMNKVSPGPSFVVANIAGLTWEGYDFLDDIRNETVWKKTQAQIKKTTGTASLEMVKEVAKTFVREMLLSGLT